MANVKFYKVSSLVTFNSSKHSGLFVHLTADQKSGETVVNKAGLYFGGANGWEYLTTNKGSMGTWNPTTKTFDGAVDGLADSKEVRDAIIANEEVTAASLNDLNTRIGSLETVGSTKVEASTTNGNIKIDGTETTVYTHPTSAGNKHIPAGGSTGQILKYSAAGTAVWANDNDTTYTFAEGTTDYSFSVTPSGGTASTIKVHGLNEAAKKTVVTTLDATAALPTSAAVKTYVDNAVTGASNYLGTITKKSDLSTSAKKGDFYRVSDITATNWSGVTNIHIGDIIIAEKDTPTASVDSTNWTLLHNELNTDSVTTMSGQGTTALTNTGVNINVVDTVTNGNHSYAISAENVWIESALPQ